MSLFFDLLSTDLQIHILLVWLNAKDSGSTIVRVLSALDLACSSTAFRPSFSSLLQQLPAFGDYAHINARMQGIKYGISYLQWLSERQIRVKTIFLEGLRINTVSSKRNAERTNALVATLSSLSLSADSIIWTKASVIAPRLKEAVLRTCPSLTYLDIDSFAGGFLINIQLPTLRRLSLTGLYGQFFNERDMSTLEAMVPNLTELLCKDCWITTPLLTLFGKYCDNLQVLAIRENKSTFEAFLTFLRSCQTLRELQCYGGSLEDSEIIAILSNQHINRLIVHTYSPHNDDDKRVKEMLTVRADMEYLQIGWYCWERNMGIHRIQS